jgi:hypothetical protein
MPMLLQRQPQHPFRVIRQNPGTSESPPPPAPDDHDRDDQFDQRKAFCAMYFDFMHEAPYVVNNRM